MFKKFFTKDVDEVCIGHKFRSGMLVLCVFSATTLSAGAFHTAVNKQEILNATKFH